MKVFFLIFVSLTVFSNVDSAIDDEDYRSFITRFSRDKNFLEDYARWSAKFFSQDDYIFSGPTTKGSCRIDSISIENRTFSDSVHRLGVKDIQCIAALGDSFVTGLAAQAVTPLELLVENQGISWLIGGDYAIPKLLTIPNILREFNPNLTGFSTRILLSGFYQNDRQMNFARSNARISDMLDQARALIDLLKSSNDCDPKMDWKMINIFIGTNDACFSCFDVSRTKDFLIDLQEKLQSILDIFYRSELGRIWINLIPSFDIRILDELRSVNPICETFHKQLCPCANLSTGGKKELLDEVLPKIPEILTDLVGSGRYNNRDDFTVVVQPLLTKVELPRNKDGQIDLSYFSPDCFHWSVKGHSHLALSLWNNFFEPVGSKLRTWRQQHILKCPREFLLTEKNSVDLKTQIDEIKPKDFIEDSQNSNESMSNSEKQKKSRKSYFKNTKFTVLTVFTILIFAVLIVAIGKRCEFRLFLKSLRQRRFERFNNTGDVDADEDYEVWNRREMKANIFTDEEIPKSHGDRVNLD